MLEALRAGYPHASDRLHAFLLRQGFAPSDIAAVLRRRSRGLAAAPEDDA